MDLKEVYSLGPNTESHWYYQSKAKALNFFLRQDAPLKILDIGAGSGFFSRYLLKHTSAFSACCVDINYDHEWNELENNKKIYFCKDVKNSDADLVLLMDVLEHVNDDKGLLSQYVSKVPSGTKFLISVPAFSFLWSSHDDFLGHYRRYTISEVEALIQNSGLEVVKSSYFFGFVFPIAAILRLFERLQKSHKTRGSQLRIHSFLVNYSLSFLCKIEMFFIGFNRLAGLTVFCSAKKR